MSEVDYVLIAGEKHPVSPRTKSLFGVLKDFKKFPFNKNNGMVIYRNEDDLYEIGESERIESGQLFHFSEILPIKYIERHILSKSIGGAGVQIQLNSSSSEHVVYGKLSASTLGSIRKFHANYELVYLER